MSFISNAVEIRLPLFFFLTYWNFVGNEGRKLQVTLTFVVKAFFSPLTTLFESPTVSKRFDLSAAIWQGLLYSTLLLYLLPFVNPDTQMVKLSR